MIRAKSKVLVLIAGLVLVGTGLIACGKADGFGVGGKVIITGGSR